MTTRYKYTIYQGSDDESSDPYKMKLESCNREIIKELLIDGDFVMIQLQELLSGNDDLGNFNKWETIGSCTLESDDIKGNKTTDELFKEYGNIW